MNVSNQQVTSREYKLMLNSDRFGDRNKGAERFLNLIDFLIRKQGGSIIEKQDKEERRHTSYLDTPQFTLRQNRFSLRLREEPKDFQINLKYRDSARNIAAAQDLSASQTGKIKFEEDIVPPFVSKFSHSNSVEFDAMPHFETMKDVTSLFLGIERLGIDQNTPIKTANDFRVLEVVRKLCKFQFEKTETIKASLSFWYLVDDTDWPLVSEFSFDYDAAKNDEGDLEEFSPNVVAGATGLFSALQNQMGWLDLTATTKTAFALEVL
jgi:uncharacterized protein YjbK